MDVTGVRTRARESLLASRAIDLLAAGPVDSITLIAHVCQLPMVPAKVADHLAAALLADCRDLVYAIDGRWALAPPPTPVSLVDSLASMPYVVVDVETTGSRAGAGDRITEVAAFLVEGRTVTKLFDQLINPERPIPPMITALTNISWDMVKDAPRFRDICDELLAVLSGRVFVAHNAEFDWRFLTVEVERATGRRLDGRRLCTVRLARRVLPHLRSRRLDSVAYHYGVEIAARHRAGGDALATAHILLRLLADAAAHQCESWQDLQRLLGARARGYRRRKSPAMPHAVRRDTTA